jgi:hypothetical protein
MLNEVTFLTVYYQKPAEHLQSYNHVFFLLLVLPVFQKLIFPPRVFVVPVAVLVRARLIFYIVSEVFITNITGWHTRFF